MNLRSMVTGVWLFSALLLPAQTFQTIYHFSGPSGPYAEGQLLLIGNTLYGTTDSGGTWDAGTVFKVNTNGGGYAVLKSFTNTDVLFHTNTDGANPDTGVVLCTNRLIGTTFFGGYKARGTVFSMNTNGSDFVVLSHFNRTNGQNPFISLTLAGNVFYGAASGGTSNLGVIFRFTTDGTGFSNVKNFVATNGSFPYGGVTVDGATLYGSTQSGGDFNLGTLYSLDTSGGSFITLKSFAPGDGAYPRYKMILIGNALYGVTFGSGVATNSVIFRINTDGTGFTVIKRFSPADSLTGTNTDGWLVSGGLALWHGVLYGATQWGGYYDAGVVFKINPDGTGYAVLKHFPGSLGIKNGLNWNYDGMSPLSEPTVTNGVFYGTTAAGGFYGCGTIYSVTLPPPPPLQITNSAGQPVIFWSDDQLNRTLRTTTDLASGNWTNTVTLNWTNAASNPQQIGYRLPDAPNPAGAFFRLQ